MENKNDKRRSITDEQNAMLKTPPEKVPRENLEVRVEAVMVDSDLQENRHGSIAGEASYSTAAHPDGV